MDVLSNCVPERIYKRHGVNIWVENVMNIFKVMNIEIEKYLQQQSQQENLFSNIICVIFMN